MLCEHGLGGTADVPRAARLYEQACQGGDAWACATLGALLLRGHAQAEDERQGARYLLRACDAEMPSACAELARLRMRGADEAARQEGIRLHQRACELGDGGSCGALGLLYQVGLFVERDQARSRRLFEAGCTWLYAPSCLFAAANATDEQHRAQLLAQGGDAHAATAPPLREPDAFVVACESGSAIYCVFAALLAPIGAQADQARCHELLSRGCKLGLQTACEWSRALPAPSP